MSLVLQHREVRFRKCFAHERKSLRAAEVVIAGVRRAAFPEFDFGGRDNFRLELFQILLLLRIGHLPVGVRMIFVFAV